VKLFAIIVLLLTVGCSQYFHQPLRTSSARLGSESDQYHFLKDLPEPDEPIVVAVYKFKDQTGQYKETETGTSWSTAITQGATSILLRTLEESKWFIPIEREGLNNLLNERKIIRSSRGGYESQTDQPLIPPLLFGGILLEGGIVSFDSNIMTGGAGARYFGLGSSGQYRADRITVYLRAISTSNGRILKTVYTSKTILSQQIDVGIFRYVAFQRILEAETGFTFNEPSEMAVREAIEKAVYSLIIEGAMDGLWKFKNDEDLQGEVITDYLNEKTENELIDVFGSKVEERRSNISVGLKGSIWNYDGDYKPKTFPAAGIDLEWHSHKPIAINISFGYGTFGSKSNYQGEYALSEITAKYRWFPSMKSTPFIKLGAGNLLEINNNIIDEEATRFSQINPFITAEVGYEYLIKNNLGLNTGINYRYSMDDNLDRMNHGNYNDGLWEVNIGLRYYLKNRRKTPQSSKEEKTAKHKTK